MQQIINHLLILIKWQSQVIGYLCILAFGKSFKPKVEKVTDKKYMKLSVDPLPIFGKPPIEKVWDYTDLLKEHFAKHGKELRPVRRKGGNVPPDDAICPYCGAPPDYVYDNNGGRGAFWCKVCNEKFAIGDGTPARAR